MWWNVRQAHERERAIALLEARGSFIAPCCDMSSEAKHPIPIVWKLLGAPAIQRIHFSTNGLSEQQCSRIARLFPEADVIYEQNPTIYTAY